MNKRYTEDDIQVMRDIVTEVDEAHERMMKDAHAVPGQRWRELGWLMIVLATVVSIFISNPWLSIIYGCWTITEFFAVKDYRSKWVYKALAVSACASAVGVRVKDATQQPE